MTATRIDVNPSSPSDGGRPYQVVVGVGVLSELPGLVPEHADADYYLVRRAVRRTDFDPGCGHGGVTSAAIWSASSSGSRSSVGTVTAASRR